jgi:inorganic pyrophosphatase
MAFVVGHGTYEIRAKGPHPQTVRRIPSAELRWTSSARTQLAPLTLQRLAREQRARQTRSSTACTSLTEGSPSLPGVCCCTPPAARLAAETPRRHDIPLYAAGGAVHFLCEIPKWTRAKFELSTVEPGNPLRQDVASGKPRVYRHGDMASFPRLLSGGDLALHTDGPRRAQLFNYGALPQTWESPEHVDVDTGCKGDNDPLDAVELGFRGMLPGAVAAVKVLGVLAMIDNGETDWKVLVLRLDDPLAARVHDVPDLERELPGAIDALREWLRVYKVAEGKPLNTFALEGRAMPRAYALSVIAQTHAAWASAHGRRTSAPHARL